MPAYRTPPRFTNPTSVAWPVKSVVTNRTPLATRPPRQYSGATSKMQLRENSWPARRNRISLPHRNRCVSARAAVIPPGRIGIAKVVGASKAKRFSRHSKRALRAYIWRVGGLQIAPDFQQRLTVDIGAGKVVAERERGAREARRGRRLCVAWVAEAVRRPPTLPPSRAPPPTLLAFEAI